MRFDRQWEPSFRPNVQTQLDGLSDILQGCLPRHTLTDAPRDSRTFSNPYPIFIAIQDDTKLHGVSSEAWTLRKVLVQDDHAEVVSTTYSSTCSTNACVARRTTSAMASLVTLPRHSSMITSHAMPLATCSNTCTTMMRVPRNV